MARREAARILLAVSHDQLANVAKSLTVHKMHLGAKQSTGELCTVWTAIALFFWSAHKSHLYIMIIIVLWLV
jgi:hypothetical protein